LSFTNEAHKAKDDAQKMIDEANKKLEALADKKEQELSA
jgi:ribosome recycling factor